MNSQTTKLSDAELNAVVGGLSSNVQKKEDDTISGQQHKIG
jgi:bacteriocin-like protein